MIGLVGGILAALLLSVSLTGVVRWYALKSNQLDVPNARSMHSRPTPRGGGIGIVLVILAATSWLAIDGRIAPEFGLALIPSGAVVAAIGWFDDKRPLSNRLRMSLWIPSSAWAVYWLGGLPELALGDMSLHLGWAGFAVAVVGFVWLLNLYNFMDGTDGLAGTEAVMVAGAAALFLVLGGAGPDAFLAGFVAVAALGFLVWNWPPAKIFMGDVGSGFLGFTFAVFAIHTENAGSLPLAIWGILLAVFIVDATFTVARRVKHKEPWSQPHRSHAYQVQARKHSHRAVLWTVIGINFILALAAYAAWRWPPALVPILGTVVIGLSITWWQASKDGVANSPG